MNGTAYGIGAEHDIGAKMGGAVLGRSAEASSSLGERQRPTLQRAIENAYHAGKRLDETGARLNAMAEFAESLATRLCGSYPTAGPDKGRDDGEIARGGPISTVEAVNSSVESLHPRISSFEGPLSRIARAFEMIDAANG